MPRGKKSGAAKKGTAKRVVSLEKSKHGDGAETPEATEEVPVVHGTFLNGIQIRDEEGKLLKLSKKDFGKEKTGRVAFCDYMILVYQGRRAKALSGLDEREKLRARIAKEEKRLTTLRESLNALS